MLQVRPLPAQITRLIPESPERKLRSERMAAMNDHVKHEGSCYAVFEEGSASLEPYTLMDLEDAIDQYFFFENNSERTIYKCCASENKDITSEFAKEILEKSFLKFIKNHDSSFIEDFLANAPLWLFNGSLGARDKYERRVLDAVRETIEEADAMQRHEDQERTW